MLFLQSTLPEALLARACARWQLAEDARGDAQLAQLAFDDFELAILGGLSSKDTYHRAALAAATIMIGENRRVDDPLAEKVREYTRRAIEQGLPRDQACNEPRIGTWARQLTGPIAVAPRVVSPVEGLIDPLADESHPVR